jgi:hypothetical protein
VVYFVAFFSGTVAVWSLLLLCECWQHILISTYLKIVILPSVSRAPFCQRTWANAWRPAQLQTPTLTHHSVQLWAWGRIICPKCRLLLGRGLVQTRPPDLTGQSFCEDFFIFTHPWIQY